MYFVKLVLVSYVLRSLKQFGQPGKGYGFITPATQETVHQENTCQAHMQGSDLSPQYPKEMGSPRGGEELWVLNFLLLFNRAFKEFASKLTAPTNRTIQVIVHLCSASGSEGVCVTARGEFCTGVTQSSPATLKWLPGLNTGTHAFTCSPILPALTF